MHARRDAQPDTGPCSVREPSGLSFGARAGTRKPGTETGTFREKEWDAATSWQLRYRGDSAKIDPLSLYLYGLFEHFSVQIREWKSYHLEGNYLAYKYQKLNWLIPIPMKYDVIFINGSRGPSYLTIEVRWTPQFLNL